MYFSYLAREIQVCVYLHSLNDFKILVSKDSDVLQAQFVFILCTIVISGWLGSTLLTTKNIMSHISFTRPFSTQSQKKEQRQKKERNPRNGKHIHNADYSNTTSKHHNHQHHYKHSQQNQRHKILKEKYHNNHTLSSRFCASEKGQWKADGSHITN